MTPAEPKPRITVTDAARKKFLEVVQGESREGQGLRVIVRGGGSPEPDFALNFVAPDENTDDDVVVDAGEFRVHMDRDSARWLDGATVDYVDLLTESGFKVDAPNTGPPELKGPVAEAVQRVLRDKVNPAIASHGGRVSLVAIEDETAYLRFGGGCQGCGMIDVTLKQGIERELLAEVPEIKQVKDVTDHGAGTNPYYQSAK